MTEKSAVFETTYQKYLDQLAAIDLLYRADRPGAQTWQPNVARCYPAIRKAVYTISRDGVRDANGIQANFAISVVLCCYTFCNVRKSCHHSATG